MTANQPVLLTGRDIALSELGRLGMPAIETSLRQLHGREPELFDRMRSRRPAVVVVSADNVQSLDIMGLRWMFRGGVTPLVLCPSSATECLELARIAASAAGMLQGPVFLLLEDDVACRTLEDAEPQTDMPELVWDEPLPAVGLDDDDELRVLEARMNAPLRGFAAVDIVPCPPELGRAEWLLLAYGAGADPAREAAARAREQGVRVNLLTVRQLWPVPEEALLKAAMGIKHIVVAERNLGQYAQEVQRLLPDPAVIGADARTERILARLQRAPRCC